MAVAARMGAGKPEIGSVETFKRALINAKSITYPPQGTVGIHLAKVFDRLGIAEQMKAKTRPQQTVAGVPRSVAAGEAELGFTPCTALISIEGVNVLGPFPPELQHDIVYTAAVGAAARQPDAAKALITFLTTPHAAIVMAANGLQGVR